MFVIGQSEGYSKIKDTIIDYIYDYFRDKIVNIYKNSRLGRLIFYVDAVMNLTAYDIINLILKQYGFGYLLKYIFYLSLVI